MKITAFDIFAFKLPLAQPFAIKGRPISKREGLLIRLTSEDGNVGFGEISPLPGLSKESLEEAREQVVDLRSKFLNKKIASLPSVARNDTNNLSQLFPSGQFGLETAIFNLLTDQEEIASTQQNIPLIGLLQGSIEEIVSEARWMLKQGFRNFKLKVGTKNISKDIEKVQSVLTILKNQATLRLDANQFWKFEDALRFAKAIQKDSIEYIEEPFKDISTQFLRVSEFFKKTGVCVVLDESLVGMNPKNFKPLKGIKAFILKPTILGGIESTYDWIKRAKALKIQAVISSSFESGVGLSMLAQLAASFDCFPAGLDTYKYFLKDLLIEPFQMDRGNFIIPARPFKEKDLDFTLLTDVTNDTSFWGSLKKL